MAVLAVAIGGVAQAQSPADDFSRRQDEKAQAQRLDRLKQATPDEPDIGEGMPGLPVGEAAGRCFPISRVVVDGAANVSPQEIDRLTQPYQDRCMGVADISGLLKALTNLYLDKGFVTSRAYVPPQDIAGTRLLKLTVVEGTISDIYLNGKPTERNGALATAFPGMKAKIADIRDVEQGLDQMNRLSSNDAKTSMLPGMTQGTSILNVENKPGKRWHLTLANNNLGQESTGYSQSNVSLGFDDLLGLNDQLGLSYGHSGPDYPWGGDGDGRSNSYSGNASIPYGYWTLSANGSWYEYDSSVPGSFGPIETSGDSAELGLGVDRVVNRNKNSITTIRGGLTYKQTDNFLLGNRIEVGSRRYSVGTIGISHSRQMLGGVFAFDLTLDQGLDLFDAVEAGEPGAGTADPRFSKFGATVSGTRPFEISGERFELTTLLSGQYSPDNLFGAEQIGLGGYSNVRGIRQSVIFGNNGLFSHNEVAWRTAPFEGGQAAAILGEVRPYLGLDFGRVFSQRRFDIEGGHLASWTVGAKLVGGTVSADFGYSKTFASSVDEGRGNLIFASATVRW
ncbi:ShlB/FhaC/HecB family hemolysin secretion/activation protein [Rhizobium sp. R693]|uniref:ShlB/FhaC/HecB family hemolysin secretion/activation protein n=1 Tax=Rhizobium sp. R693 TaxID=1764276 RepID=UPI000B536A88|nr:ShlB/FhaC/HecB family hemolysin secretion/activation protein [Rhizobium sp. R693]OWV99184.1 hemin transporter [Rhizobium sp. R693]